MAAIQFFDERVALHDFSSKRRQTGLVVLGLGVDILGLGLPEVDFLLGELLRARLCDLQPFLQLRDLGPLGFGDFFQMPGFLLPARSLGLDHLEPVREHVELLLQPILGRLLAFELRIEILGTGFGSSQRILQESESLLG